MWKKKKKKKKTIKKLKQQKVLTVSPHFLKITIQLELFDKKVGKPLSDFKKDKNGFLKEQISKKK